MSNEHKESFPSGSVRSSRKGKGRFDLISPYALRRLALRLELGAELYGPRNWEKGQPIERFYDSAMRHMNNYKAGMRDEDHLGAAFFNIMGMLHFDEMAANNLVVPDCVFNETETK